MSTLLLQNGTLVTEDGEEGKDVLVAGGAIERIEPNINKPADEVIDASELLIFPGFIDCHVHFREPGMEEAETLETGALSARSGGVTTVCAMPNTDPPTCTRAALEEVQKRAEHVKDCDIRFFFGIANEEHLKELEAVDRNKICGVKLYLGHSTGNQMVEKGVEEQAFKVCAEKGTVLVCHCEDEEIIQNNRRGALPRARTVDMHSQIRSVEAAVTATTHAIELAKKQGTHLHIAHLSTKEELELVAQAKSDGLNITCEVAPHHLFLSIDNYATLGTLGKMNPPLRTNDHCDALWEGVTDGTVDCIATDHAPHTLASKQTKNPLDAPSGVPGVETMVPLMLSCIPGPGPSGALGKAPLQTTDILRLCFTNPNRLFTLGKPGIAVGAPADLVLIDPRATWTIRGAELHSKCGWTPFEGWNVQGRVVRVIR